MLYFLLGLKPQEHIRTQGLTWRKNEWGVAYWASDGRLDHRGEEDGVAMLTGFPELVEDL